MRYLIFAVMLNALGLGALTLAYGFDASPLRAPRCLWASDACLAQWYEYGDVTGDYGAVDRFEN